MKYQFWLSNRQNIISETLVVYLARGWDNEHSSIAAVNMNCYSFWAYSHLLKNTEIKFSNAIFVHLSCEIKGPVCKVLCPRKFTKAQSVTAKKLKTIWVSVRKCWINYGLSVIQNIACSYFLMSEGYMYTLGKLCTI